MASYGLRVRFHAAHWSIKDEQKQMVLPIPSIDGTATIKAIGADNLHIASQFAIQLVGFQDAQTAEAVGRRIQSALLLCGARQQIGVDIGKDTRVGGLTRAGIEWGRSLFNIPANVPVLQDVHGLVVYEDFDPPPRFVGSQASGHILKDGAGFGASLGEAFDLAPAVTPRQRIALEMYNLSHFEASEPARFISLVTAVECLAERRASPPEVRSFVSRFVAEVQAVDAAFDPATRDSFLGRLRDLGRESIGKACEAAVGGHLGEESRKRFKTWYNIRSKLVHEGTLPPEGNLTAEITGLDATVSRLIIADVVSPQAT